MCADSASEQGVPALPQAPPPALHRRPALASAAAQPQHQQQVVLANSPSQSSGFWTGAAAATWACQRGTEPSGSASAAHGSTPAAATGQLPAVQGTPAQLACHSAQLLAVQQRCDGIPPPLSCLVNTHTKAASPAA